jgi:GTPase Era involved in 16S rRNA processing
VAETYELTTNDLHTQLNILKQECERHGFSEQSERVSQRIRDLNEPLLIMVVGEGNFGKSTLINALIGKDVAPVSILPKTWKVDLYEAAQDKEEAWLYTRKAPDKPKKASISEAVKICEEEENKAKSMKDNGHSWKSDLFQVRWSINADWPQKKTALVDTPGFSQLRADTSVSDIKLYGSNGIQIAASDAFEYYYYRADIVLWCINGNKVQDQDTLDALAKVHVQDKHIIGVITKMDRIPDNRWQEIQNEASKTFGKYIKDFVCTAAGAKSDIKHKTITNLKSLIEQRFINSGAKNKSVTKYSSEESNILVNYVDAIMDCYAKNIATRDKLLSSISNNIARAFDTAINEVESAWKSIESSAVSKLDGYYERCDGDVERFRRLVSESCIDTYEINNKISRVLSSTRDRTDAEIQVAISKIVWDGVLIGGTKAAPLRFNDTSLINTSVNFRASGIMNLNLSAGEGVGAGIAAGGVAAAVAAFALGPIGLAAGLVGFFVGKLTKKSNCISEAKSKISSFCSSNKQPILDSLNKNKKYYSDAINSHLESSFVSHHGKNFNQIIKHIMDADSTVNNLSCLPSKTKYLVPSGIYSSFKFVNSNGNKWSVYYYNNGAGRDWDGAVVQEWKQSIIPVLKNRLVETNTAPFHVDNLGKIKSEFLNGVRKEIISRVTGSDWSNTENGLTVSVSDIILNSGASKQIKAMLPNADEIITGTGNKRLGELKHHKLSMKEHFTKTFNSSMSNLIGNFSESIVVRLPRFAMMAMLAVALLVYCSRYVDTTWIKIVFQCGGVVGIWSIYANNYEQDSFVGFFMMSSLALILTTIWYFNIIVFYLLFLPAAMLLIYIIIAYVNLFSRAKEDSNKAFDNYINKLSTESMQLINRGLNI